MCNVSRFDPGFTECLVILHLAAKPPGCTGCWPAGWLPGGLLAGWLPDKVAVWLLADWLLPGCLSAGWLAGS